MLLPLHQVSHTRSSTGYVVDAVKHASAAPPPVLLLNPAHSCLFQLQHHNLCGLCRLPPQSTGRDLPYVQQLSAGREVPIKDSCNLCCCLRDSLCIQSMPVMRCKQQGELGNG